MVTHRKLAFLMLCGAIGIPMRLLGGNEPPLAPTAKADKVLVLKGERKLVLMKGKDALKTYHISLGSEPVGPKIQQGDHKTPEGLYVLDRRNSHSQFYRSIHISYRARRTSSGLKSWAFLRAGISSYTVCQTATAGSLPAKGCMTGLTAALRSQIRKWMRSGERSTMGRQSRSNPEHRELKSYLGYG